MGCPVHVYSAGFPSGTSALVEFGYTAQANDIIFVQVAFRNSGTLSVSGYTGINTKQSVDSWDSQWFGLIASGGETSLTMSKTGSAGVSSAHVHIIRGGDTSSTLANAIDTSGFRVGSVGGTLTSAALTTGSANCHIIHGAVWDGSSVIAEPSDLHIEGHATQSISGSTFKATAGAIPTFTFTANSTTNTGCAWAIAVKNGSGGDNPIRLTDGRDYLQRTGGFVTLTTSAPDSVTGLASVLGIPMNTVANTISGAMSLSAGQPQTAPWPIPGFRLATTESLTAEAWAGAFFDLPSATDVAGKVVCVPYGLGSATDTTRIGRYGMMLVLADASNNYYAYSIIEQRVLLPHYDNVLVIKPGTSTTIASSGDPTSAVTKMGIFQHRKTGTSSSQDFYMGLPVIENDVCAIIGGGSTNLITTERLAAYLLAGNTFFKEVSFQGSGQLVNKLGIQIGDGSAETHAKFTAQGYDIPAASDTQWRAGVSGVPFNIKASASDVIDLRSSSIVSDILQPFTIDAASSLSASILTTGLSVVGRTFSDLAGYDWTSVSWVECATVTIAGGGDLTNCTISNTASTNAALAISGNGSVITGTPVDGTGALYALELASGVKETSIASSTLTAGSTNKIHTLKTSATVAAGAFVSGDHYEIKTVGTTDFTLIGASANTIGVRFTATGAGSGTGDTYAAVKITTSGTTSIAESDVTSAGAVVWVAAPELYQEVAITGLAPTYRLQLFDIEYVLTVSGITVTPTAGATYTHGGITWTVRAASITAGAGTITVYGTGTPAASGTLTKTGGTGDASVAFSAYAVDGTELYIGVPAATSYTWTDSIAAAAPRVIRVRVMEDGPGTADAILMIDAIVGQCGITDGTTAVGYLVAAQADDVYNDRGVDGSAITGITIDDTTLRLEIASGTITNYNGTDVLVVDGRDLYAYETYWLGTTAGMRDEARFIEAVDAVNFRCSNFKLKGTSGYPIMINNCFIVDAATGIFSSMVDYSGDPISNHPEHMKAIVVSTSDSVVTGTLAQFVAAVPTAATNASATRTELATELTRVTKLAALSGIDATLIVTPTSREAGSVSQTITTVGDTTTVESA